MAEIVIPYHADYGAPELKKNLQKFTAHGFVIAAVLHFMAIGAYWSSTFLAEEEPREMVRIRTILGPPPSIARSLQAIAVARAPVTASVGVPVSVPDAEVNPEQTIRRQDEFPGVEGPVEGLGGETVEVAAPLRDFEIYEKEPIPIRQVWPAYPEIARRAGVEGDVQLKVWVDRQGKVRKAEILKSSQDVFNQPSIDAAMQWVFTPALMNSGPVSVWVSIPFRFRLQRN